VSRTLAIWAFELLLLAPLALASDPNAPVTIYVARRQWHVDLGFAAKDLEPPLRSLTADFPDAQFLFFGFGDRHYLLAKHRSFRHWRRSGPDPASYWRPGYGQRPARHSARAR
jgi:hypothetical protein